MPRKRGKVDDILAFPKDVLFKLADDAADSDLMAIRLPHGWSANAELACEILDSLPSTPYECGPEEAIQSGFPFANSQYLRAMADSS